MKIKFLLNIFLMFFYVGYALAFGSQEERGPRLTVGKQKLSNASLKRWWSSFDEIDKRKGEVFKLSKCTNKIDSDLLAQMREIARPSYEDYTTLFDKDLKECTDLYGMTDENGQLQSFFMTSWGKMLFRDRYVSAVFMGMSATRENAKNSGNIRSVYKKFFRDIISEQSQKKEDFILWHTTISPSVCIAVEKIAQIRGDTCYPSLKDGSFDETGRDLVMAIRNANGWPVTDATNPFLLHQFTVTRYSQSERERIARVTKKHNFDTFAKLGLAEEKGDRLLRAAIISPQSLLKKGMMYLRIMRPS